jgi:hypothetical protein
MDTRYTVAVLAVAAVCALTGGLMVALNLGGHAAEPAVTGTFTASGAALMLLVGAGFISPGSK